MLPIIRWIEARLPPGKFVRGRRIVIIIVLYLVFIALFALLIFYVVTTLASSVSQLIENAPDFFLSAANTIQDWLKSLRANIPPGFQSQLDMAAQNIGNYIAEAFRNLLNTGAQLIPATLGLVLGLLSLPLFLFYVLKDWENLTGNFYSGLPAWALVHTKNIMNIIEGVLGRYVKSFILLGFVVGLLDLIGLLILRIEFALVLAIFAGITEVIPTIGPWLGAAAGILVTLATAPDKIIWVAIVYLTVQLLENTFLVPRIQAGYLNIHPAIVIVLLIVGSHLAGFWGLLLVVPVTSTLVQIYNYVMKSITSENISENQPPSIEIPNKQ